MSNLLVLVGLACVVIVANVAAVRDNELTIHNNITQGSSGEVCTKFGRRCLNGEVCENKVCKCAGDRKGEAMIECVEQDENLCYLSADPHLTSYGEARVNVNMPCRYRASRFITESPDAPIPQYTSCSFEIYATNQLYRGRYIVSSAHISLGVTDSASQVHSSFEVYKTNYDVEESSIYNYLARIVKRDSIWGSSNGVIPGLDVNPSFDDVNNFAILDVKQCDTRIKYRAYDRKRALQSQLPGLSIQVPPHAKFVANLGTYPASVCGVPQDGTDLFSQRAKVLNVTNAAAAIIYDILSERPPQTDNPSEDICNAAFATFANSDNKSDDINRCAPIVVNAKISNCLTGSPFAPADPFQLFVDCLRVAQGNSDHSTCMRLNDAANLCKDSWEGPTLYTC